MFSLRVLLKWNRNVFTSKNDFNNTNKTKTYMEFQVRFLTVELETKNKRRSAETRDYSELVRVLQI